MKHVVFFNIDHRSHECRLNKKKYDLYYFLYTNELVNKYEVVSYS